MTTGSDRPRNIAIGVAAVVATVFAMAFADAIVKFASARFPLWQIFVLRSLLSVPMLAAALACASGGAEPRWRISGWVWLRSLLLTLMYVAIYAAAPILSLSTIAAALYLGPLFIALFSAFLIGEPVGARRWAALAIGFAGVLISLRPASDSFSLAALIPMIAALLYALAAVLTRAKCQNERPMTLALALNLCLLATGAVVSAALLAFPPAAAPTYPFLLGPWIAMGTGEWRVVVTLAVLIVGIGVGLAKAYQSAPPAIVATFDYCYLPFAALWSFVFFAEMPDAATALGMLLIAGGGIIAVGRRPGSA